MTTNYANLGPTSTSMAQTPTPQMYQIPGQQQAQQIVNLSPELEIKIVSWINEQYKMMKEARSRTELQWYINLAFYFGKQYVQPANRNVNLNSTLGTRLTVPAAPPWKTRLVINRIRPMIRKELAKIMSQKPTVSVVPSSSEDKDYFAAQAGEQLWDSVYRSKKLKYVFSRAVWWALITGCGYVKCWWDPNEIDKDNNLQGDFCYDPITPFHILVPNLREEDIEAQPYLIHVQTRSLDWINTHYPQLADAKGDTTEVNDILEDSFMNLVSGPNANDKQNAVLIKECWIKPNEISQMPSGGLVTVIRDRVVQFWQNWPYEHSKYPFAKIDHIRSGKYYCTSTIEDLIPLQKELNRTRSQIVEAKNTMAKPRLIAARGSVDPSKISTQPGQVILYTPGFAPPEPLPMAPLPAYVIQEVERILIDFNDISGQHEVSKGQVPPGVTAATAISYLQEQDESMLSSTFDSVEDMVEKIAVMTLSYISQYWVIDRVVKIVGQDGTFDAMTFKGADLHNNTDIRVEAGSALPTSKAAKQAFIMDLMKMGFIDPQQGLEVMDVGGLNKITEQVQKDAKQAQRENLKMAAITKEDLMMYEQLTMQQAQVDPNTGMPQNPENLIPGDPSMQDPTMNDMPIQPQVLNPPLIIPTNTWDNHQIHILKHNDFRKSQAFEQLSPEIKQLFEAHVQDHIAAITVQPPVGNVNSDPNVAQSDPQQQYQPQSLGAG